MDKVSSAQMVEIDKKVPEKYGITISRMMENAAHQIADFIRKEVKPESIAVYAGKGNNGGDALAAARRHKLPASSPLSEDNHYMIPITKANYE